MEIIKPWIEVENYDGVKIMKNIERACRTCYRSEGSITDDSYKRLLNNCINRGHESVLEHEKISVRMCVDVGLYKDLSRHRTGTAFSIESTRYCVAEGMRIDTTNPHNHFTIDSLYNNKNNSSNGAWKRIKIKNINEQTGEIEYHNIKNIFYTGEKPCIEIKTSLGYTIVLTPDHLIYTPEGYLKAEDLKIGGSIYVNGQTIADGEKYKNYDWLYYQNITLNKTFVQISNEFEYNVSTLKKWARKLNIPKKGTGYFNIGRIPWNKGLSENDNDMVKIQADTLRKFHWGSDKEYAKSEDGSDIMKIDTVNYQKHNEGYCKLCNNNRRKVHVHHKDENRDNNNPKNLISLCNNCHQQVHNKSLTFIYGDEIVEINNAGIKKVYDIEMDDINHNFVANGVVVHNCNYSKDKFTNNIKFIDPVFITDENNYACWKEAMKNIETFYMAMANNGAAPDQLRMLLPHSTAAEVSMTCNIREWRHILDLRCSKMVHPSIRQVLIPLLLKFKEDMPELFQNVPYDEDFPKEWYAEIKTMGE